LTCSGKAEIYHRIWDLNNLLLGFINCFHCGVLLTFVQKHATGENISRAWFPTQMELGAGQEEREYPNFLFLLSSLYIRTPAAAATALVADSHLD